MKWEDIKSLYEKLKMDKRVEKDTKIQIKYNTKKKKNHTGLCKIEDFKKHMFKILEGDDIVAMIIYLVDKEVATPIFRYNANKPVIELKPLPNNNSLVKNWKNYSANTRKTLVEMTARIIMEYTDDGSDAPKDTKSS